MATEKIPKQKSKTKLTKPVQPAVRHEWRVCPLGQHWVKKHTRQYLSGKITTVSAHCQSNQSKLDSLTPDEVKEIASRHFKNLENMPCPNMYEFEKRPNVDQFIAGWTQYWNDIFEPEVLLDPNIVKALIASESSFRNLDPSKDGEGQGDVRGLMQITDETIKVFRRGKKKELKNHFIEFSDDDLMDENINICVGIRWLFHKRKLSEISEGKDISWERTIVFYKGLRNKDSAIIDKKMGPFRRFLAKLEGCK